VKHTFNPHFPGLDDKLSAPSENDILNVVSFKYADYDYVYKYCDNDYVRYVLNNIPIFGQHKRVLIDLKVHDLKPEFVPCVPGWHLDGSINPKKLPKQPEIFTLFVTGEHSLTEFLTKEIQLEVNDRWDFAMMSKACSRLVPKDYPSQSIPSCQFASYGDHYFHRGKLSTGYERRLLVRTTETDIIEPQNKIYTPYIYP